MALNPVQNTTGTTPTVTAQSNRAEIDMNTFLRLLTVQLATQNPLEPMSDRDFFAQMAQLGQVSSMDQIKSSLEVTQAAALMGKTVTAVRTMTDSGSLTGNSLVTGVVKGLTIRNGENFLSLQEPDGGRVEVRVSNIRQIA